MTQKELKQIIHLKREIAILRNHAPENCEDDGVIDARVNELNALIVATEKFILGVPDSRIRVILTLRYINGASWHDVAKTIYKNMTADAARMCVTRWLKQNSK
ncbi:MAG: hypothetical protein FWB96_12620 [Defluviitaleaceae bacterium]|nr:hypothetical protein [Defluviitaleaceae bacterium]MCL2263969.1 hypothetical protein [Defluviitaleaceae bacterium]